MKRTLAILLAFVMLLCLCAACGSAKEEETAAPVAEAAAPVAEAAAPAPAEAAAPAAEPAGGEASGEASGAPEVQSMMPDEGSHAFSKDFEGYREYVLEALANDVNAPAELHDVQVAELSSMTEENYADGSYYQSLTGLGVFVTYEEFLTY